MKMEHLTRQRMVANASINLPVSHSFLEFACVFCLLFHRLTAAFLLSFSTKQRETKRIVEEIN